MFTCKIPSLCQNFMLVWLTTLPILNNWEHGACPRPRKLWTGSLYMLGKTRYLQYDMFRQNLTESCLVTCDLKHNTNKVETHNVISLVGKRFVYTKYWHWYTCIIGLTLTSIFKPTCELVLFGYDDLRQTNSFPLQAVNIVLMLLSASSLPMLMKLIAKI